MSTYRISELARRTGVPASTLRFYEQAGLLPAARMADAERRIAELSAFAAHLAAVHEELGGLPTVQECGPGWVCVPAEPPAHVERGAAGFPVGWWTLACLGRPARARVTTGPPSTASGLHSVPGYGFTVGS